MAGQWLTAAEWWPNSGPVVVIGRTVGDNGRLVAEQQPTDGNWPDSGRGAAKQWSNSDRVAVAIGQIVAAGQPTTNSDGQQTATKQLQTEMETDKHQKTEKRHRRRGRNRRKMKRSGTVKKKSIQKENKGEIGEKKRVIERL